MTESPQTRTSQGIYRWVGLAAVVFCIVAFAAREYCFRWIGTSLVGVESVGNSDAIVINGANYLLFERAEQLQSRGLAEVVLIPVANSENNDQPALVSMGFVDVMRRISRVQHATTFNVPEREPSSLDIANRSAEQLRARGARSVIVITGGFGSRNAAEIYSRLLKPLGINVYMQPVFGLSTPDNWFRSWHGFQQIGLELGKLWYYRLVVL